MPHYNVYQHNGLRSTINNFPSSESGANILRNERNKKNWNENWRSYVVEGGEKPRFYSFITEVYIEGAVVFLREYPAKWN